MAEATKIRDPKVKEIFQLFEDTGYNTHFVNPHSSDISALNTRCNDNINSLEALIEEIPDPEPEPPPETFNTEINSFIDILDGIISDNGSITSHHNKLLRNYTTILGIAVSFGENTAALDESDPVANFQEYFESILKDEYGGLIPANITYINGVLDNIETILAPLTTSEDLTQQIIDDLTTEFDKLATLPNNVNAAISNEVDFFGAPILDGPFDSGPALANLTNLGRASKLVIQYKDSDLAPFFDGTLSATVLTILDGD